MPLKHKEVAVLILNGLQLKRVLSKMEFQSGGKYHKRRLISRESRVEICPYGPFFQKQVAWRYGKVMRPVGASVAGTLLQIAPNL